MKHKFLSSQPAAVTQLASRNNYSRVVQTVLDTFATKQREAAWDALIPHYGSDAHFDSLLEKYNRKGNEDGFETMGKWEIKKLTLLDQGIIKHMIQLGRSPEMLNMVAESTLVENDICHCFPRVLDMYIAGRSDKDLALLGRLPKAVITTLKETPYARVISEFIPGERADQVSEKSLDPAWYFGFIFAQVVARHHIGLSKGDRKGRNVMVRVTDRPSIYKFRGNYYKFDVGSKMPVFIDAEDDSVFGSYRMGNAISAGFRALLKGDFDSPPRYSEKAGDLYLFCADSAIEHPTNKTAIDRFELYKSKSKEDRETSLAFFGDFVDLFSSFRIPEVEALAIIQQGPENVYFSDSRI